MSILSYLTLLLTPIFFLIQAQDCLAAACPSRDTIQQKVQKTFRQNISVVKIQHSAVPGLCEVQMNF